MDPDQIHAATAPHIQRLHELSNQSFGEFITLFGLEKIRYPQLSG
jgi:hypothetical protein